MINQLVLDGYLGEKDFSLEGTVSGHLKLPEFDIELTLGKIFLSHNETHDTFSLELQNVRLGELGSVDKAALFIEFIDNPDSSEKDFTFRIETKLSWQTLRDNLKLDQLPDFFPLPPDDGEITAFLTWGNNAWQLRFSADVEDVDSMWRFVPEQYRPEVKHAKFIFAASHKENDVFNGQIALDITFRLPGLPDVPGSDLLQITTGDEEGWITAILDAGITGDKDSNPYIKGSLKNSLAIAVNLPVYPSQNHRFKPVLLILILI